MSRIDVKLTLELEFESRITIIITIQMTIRTGRASNSFIISRLSGNPRGADADKSRRK
jgi:hypothetical protein